MYPIQKLSFQNLLKGPLYVVVCLLFSFSGLYSQEISTVGEIYNFEVGNIFHEKHFSSYSSGDWYSSEYNYEIVDKYFTANNETINYKRSGFKREKNFVDTVWAYSYYEDTISYINASALINSGMIDNVYSNPDMFNGRTINEYSYDDFSSFVLSLFVEGCGLAKYNAIDYASSSILSELVYFKKGGEEWGTPNLELVSIESNKRPLPMINFYPNPAKDQLNISVDDYSNTSLSIFSMTGNQVITKELYSKISTIDVSNLNPGIYAVLIRNERQTIRKIFIKE